MMPARSPEDKRQAPLRLLHSPEALEHLAAEFSLLAKPCSAVLISGDLGSGKSTFARAFIRELARGTADFDVPSPTFTLVQTYAETRIPVAHVDLYRTNAPDEVAELALDELIRTHILLVEWPERLGSVRWPDVLHVNLSGKGEERQLRVTAEGAWRAALGRNEEISRFIAATAWNGADRSFFEGDASARRYELLRKRGDTALLMDMPARPDGPPVYLGKSYSAVAHLAENIQAVIAVNSELRARKYSAPYTHAYDAPNGLAVIEDLGRGVFARKFAEGENMREPLKAAVELLADMARQDWPEVVPRGNGRGHRIPRYDEDALLIEVSLLPSWFWPHLHGAEAPSSATEEFTGLWREILPAARPEKPVWTLRDYHSPNLLWLPGRAGLRRVGLIDTQDCVLGHPAYDLASLLQDARVDVPAPLAEKMFNHYCELRAAEGGFNRDSFGIAFALLGAQRATKILGIFARLARRDGKYAYLKHIPRVARHLKRNLAQPGLHRLRRWFETHLPVVFEQ